MSEESTWSVEPLGDVVIARRDEPPTESPGGIVLVAPARDSLSRATVIAVGPGVWEPDGFRPTTLRPGDRIVVSRYWGDEVDVDGTMYTFGREGDVLTRIEGEGEDEDPNDALAAVVSDGVSS